MPRPAAIAALSCLLAWVSPALAASSAAAGDEPIRCGTTSATGALSTLAIAPGDSVIEARIVFVTFPDSPDSTLPVWADSMANELSDFYRVMSGGRVRMQVSVVRRADAASLAWRAPQAAAKYAGPRGLRWWTANREVLTTIGAEQPGVWAGVEHVWVLHDQCTFACTDTASPARCEDTCPWAGIATLGLLPGTVPGLDGDGTTQRFLVNLPPSRQHHVQLSVAAHEFGHRIADTPHSPGSEDPAASWINYGRYDLMRSGVNGSFAREEGLVPYHPVTLADWGWKPRVRIERDTLGLHVPDLWSARGAVFEVRPAASVQSFVLAHHGARTAYDARYGGAGLHVWHVRRNAAGSATLSWDLESAVGRHIPPQGLADAIQGRDPLEADPFALGSGADFFAPGSAREFSALTNPASGLYVSDAADAEETVPSGVAIENLRTDPATGDLLIDVWTTPAQALESLAARTFAIADGVTLRWRVRPSARVVAVDVALVRADGSVRPLAQALPNDGQWTWTADEAGAGLRLELTGRTADARTGRRTSESFDVGRPEPEPAALAFAPPKPQPARGQVTLALSLPSPGIARVEILDVSGRRVRVLAEGRFAAGATSIEWDGRDDQGRRVAAGLYLARMSAAGERRDRRIVWLP